MRKVVRMVLALLVILMAYALPADARDGHFRRHGGGHVNFGLYVGPGWWGPGWWDPYPYYYPYSPPPVIVEKPPEIYVQPSPRAEEPRYWYYCPDPQGYYPYVKKCPKGWMKVVPPDEPEGEE